MAKKLTPKMGIDSTKTGPLGLRGLPGLRREGVLDTYLTARTGDNDAMAIMQAVTGRPSDYTDWGGYWQPSPAPEAKGLGESVYDSPIMIDPSQSKIQNERAEAQSAALKWINGISKGFLTAATTFIDGTVGLITGLGNMAITGEFSKLWDNPVTRTMQAITDWSEKALPNYRTVEEQEAPFWENLDSANFWADTIVKNFGFLVGAYFSGGVVTKPISLLGKGAFTAARARNAGYNTLKNITKASRAVNKISHAALSAAAEGSIEAINNSRDWFNQHKEQIDNYYVNALAQAKEQYGEGTPQYEQAANDIATAYRDSLAKLDEDRKDMGNADLLMNMPILMASNLVQFGRFLGNGFKSSRKFAGINGIIGDWGAFKAATTNKKAYLSGIKNTLSEGAEEMSQKIASDFAGNYQSAQVINNTIDNFRKAKYDTGAKKETVDMMTAFSKAFTSNLTDPKSWEEFFVGALYGALGMPSVRKAKTAEGKWQSPITLNGGFIGEVSHQKELMRQEQELANYMNKRANDPQFKLYYEGMIRNRFYQKKMDQEAAEGKQKEFKDDQLNQLISDVVMFDRAGKLDVLKSHIAEMNALTDEDIDDIIEGTTREYTTKQQKASIIDQINALTSQNGLIEEHKQELEDELIEIKKQLARARRKNDEEAIQYLKEKRESVQEELGEYKGNIKRKKSGYYSQLYQDNQNQISTLQQKLDSLSEEDSTKEFGGFYNATNQPMSRDEVKEKVKKNTDEVTRLLDVYRDFMDRVELEYGDNFTNEQLETLVWLRGRIDGGARRSKNLFQELKNRKDKAIQSYKEEEKAFQESLVKQREKLEDKFDENSKENRETKKRLEKTKKNIDLIEEFYNELEKRKNENIEDGLTSARDIYANYKYIKPLVELFGNSISKEFDDFQQEHIQELISAAFEGREPNLAQFSSLESDQQKLTDIVRLANDVNAFYKKLDEYLKSPQKLTKDQDKGKTTEASEKIDESVKDIANQIKKATTSKDILDILEQNKVSIDNLGGKNTLLKKLPVSLKDKVEKALNGSEIAKKIVAKTGVDTDSDVGSLINKFVSDAVDKAEKLEVPNIIEQLQDDKALNAIATSIVGDEVAGLELSQQALEALANVDSADISDAINEITKRNIEEEAARKEQEEMSQIQKASDEEAKKNQEGGPKAPPADVDDNNDDGIDQPPTEDPNKDAIDEVEQNFDEGNSDKQKLGQYNNGKQPTSKELINDGKPVGDNGSVDSGGKDANHDPNYGNRPQISQAYFWRKPSDTIDSYADHLGNSWKEFKGKWPKGITTDEQKKQYFEYIKEITKFLQDNGTFEYIRGGNLKVGDKIVIGIDPELNKRCHTVVPLLIKVDKDNEENESYQVVGSLKTDFEYLDKDARKNLKQLYEFYQKFKEEVKDVKNNTLTNHTTTVESLKGGNIAFSDQERTLKEIHQDDVPVIGYSLLGESKIVVPGNPRAIVRVHDESILADTPFRLYTLVKCHNGVFLPAIVRSAKLKDLLNSVDDWYIQETIKAIQELTASTTPSAIEDASKKVKKWLYLPGGVYSHFIDKNGKHFLRYSFLNNEGNREYRQIGLSGAKIEAKEAMALIKQVTLLFENTYISVDLDKINTDKEYTQNISRYLTANLIVTGNKSINDWFTFNPIDGKSKKPKSLKPNKQQGTYVKVGDKESIVDNTGDATDSEGSSLDASTQQKAQTTATEKQNKGKTSISNDDVKSLMGTKKSKTDNSSNNSSATSPKRTQPPALRALRNKRPRLVDESTEEPKKLWNKEEELAWLNRVLPQLTVQERIKLVKGLINAGSQGEKAWGMFDGAMITLSESAAEGTVPHEAFHVVFNLLLTKEEQQSLLDEYREKSPQKSDLELEEDLAEDFREFVMNGGKDTRSLARKIIDFFKSLFIKTKYWESFRPSAMYYFKTINEGKYAKKNIPMITLNKTRYASEEYTQEMKDILAKALRDTEGKLLAPNDKVSNLTERQYAQVRTKAFKD